MKTDVERAYEKLEQIANGSDYAGIFEARHIFQVRNEIECGIEQVKTAAKRFSLSKDISRAETIDDLKSLMTDMAKEIFR